ncbi:uncharacterized protein LOC135398392 [Ornithodoros turicata]|uniref:uncharacterized protein LOC135398392 n=1 Tax=Ornithodoros turicata TaxID=34597 RepID=UPI00313A3856
MLNVVVYATLLSFCYACPHPRLANGAKISYGMELSSRDGFNERTVASYSCDPGYKIVGPSEAICQRNGSWSPSELPVCVTNVASKKPAYQLSTSDVSRLAANVVDGSLDTCYQNSQHNHSLWLVDLLQVFPVVVVELSLDLPTTAILVAVRVGNNSKDPLQNPICSIFDHFLPPVEMSQPHFYLSCVTPIVGRYVSVHDRGALSICELSVYSTTLRPVPAGTTTQRPTQRKPVPKPMESAIILTATCITLGIVLLATASYFFWKKGNRVRPRWFKRDCSVIVREFPGETNLAFESCGERNLELGYQMAWQEVSRSGVAALTPVNTRRDASTMTTPSEFLSQGYM